MTTLHHCCFCGAPILEPVSDEDDENGVEFRIRSLWIDGGWQYLYAHADCAASRFANEQHTIDFDWLNDPDNHPEHHPHLGPWE